MGGIGCIGTNSADTGNLLLWDKNLLFCLWGFLVSCVPLQMGRPHPCWPGEDDRVALNTSIESGLQRADLALCYISSPISCSVGGRELVLNYLQAVDNNQPP